MKDEEFSEAFGTYYKAYSEAAKEVCGADDDNARWSKREAIAFVMAMCALYDKRIAYLEALIGRLSSAVEKTYLAVDNLALQTANNQAENRKAFAAIRAGVLDTNLAVKYPDKK